MSAIPNAPYISPEEYLELERVSQDRHEYFRGEMFAMSGGTREHSLIASNLVGALCAAIEDRPCEAHGSDMRIKVVATGLYTYPDVSVICGDPELEDGHKDTVLNPLFVAEVLSASTEAYDRGFKCSNYRRIDSLKEYVLISQRRVLVERYVRKGDDWLLTEFHNLDDKLHLDSLGYTISLKTIYRRVELPPTTEMPRVLG